MPDMLWNVPSHGHNCSECKALFVLVVCPLNMACCLIITHKFKHVVYRHFPENRLVRKHHLTVRSSKKFFVIYYLYDRDCGWLYNCTQSETVCSDLFLKIEDCEGGEGSTFKGYHFVYFWCVQLNMLAWGLSLVWAVQERDCVLVMWVTVFWVHLSCWFWNPALHFLYFWSHM
jgi:hypothetical protein